jgi:hypothetical protein
MVRKYQRPHLGRSYGRGIHLEDAANNFAMRQYIVIVITPFPGGMAERRSFQEQVGHLQKRHSNGILQLGHCKDLILDIRSNLLPTQPSPGRLAPNSLRPGLSILPVRHVKLGLQNGAKAAAGSGSRRRAAEQRDELASLIRSSASARAVKRSTRHATFRFARPRKARSRRL